MNFVKVIVASSIVMSIFGCVSTGEVKQINKITSSGNYAKMAKYAEKKLKGSFLDKLSEKKNVDLYWVLQAGSARRNLGDYEKSNQWFDDAENTYKFHNEDSILDQAGDVAVSFLVNDKATDYKGEVYDGVMINTYKALNYLALGDHAKARVEFNRSVDRQRRAKQVFDAEIKQKEEQLAKKANVLQTLDSDTVKDKFTAEYSNLDKFKVYPDFVNPYTTYISGLFYALSNDREKGMNKLKEAYAMTGNEVIKEDFENYTKGAFDNRAWVLFENGLSATKEEFNIHLPLFLVTDKLKYAGVSFPRLKINNNALSSITVKGIKSVNTQKFADMDAVIATEFKKDLPSIQARSIASAIAKTITQAQIEKHSGGVAGLFAAIYQVATTGSDTRIWSALPKSFQVASVQIPKDGKIELNIGGKIKTVDVKGAKNAIIIVRLPTALSNPVISIARFK
jgi:hypothetical protein